MLWSNSGAGTKADKSEARDLVIACRIGTGPSGRSQRLEAMVLIWPERQLVIPRNTQLLPPEAGYISSTRTDTVL